MKWKWQVEISYRKFRFDTAEEAVKFAEIAMMAWYDKEDKLPNIEIIAVYDEPETDTEDGE